MTFEQFDQDLFEAISLRAMDKGNGHWQVKLPDGRTVNYYPKSSRRTMYINPLGDQKAIKGENLTEFMAIKLVQDLCNKGVSYVQTESASNNDLEEHL